MVGLHQLHHPPAATLLLETNTGRQKKNSVVSGIVDSGCTEVAKNRKNCKKLLKKT